MTLFVPWDRAKRILTLSAPIVLAMLSANMLTMADTIMVGYLGDGPLATSGLAAMVFAIAMTSLTGLAPAVQALAARRVGEGAPEKAARPLNVGLLMGFGGGVVIGLLLYILTPYYFPLFAATDEVNQLGIPYLRYLLISLPFVGINAAFRGFWNGVGKTWVYMVVVLAMQIINILLNYALIFGKWGAPEMGLSGAGVGTVITVIFGASFYVILSMLHARDMGFLAALPKRDGVQQVMKLALPTSLHDFLLHAGFTAFFWIAGHVSTQALAATVVLARIKMIVILPGFGFGLGCATLVGMSLGAKDVKGASAWVYDVARVCFMCLSLFAVSLFLFDTGILSIFIKDPETLSMSVIPLWLISGVLLFEANSAVFKYALLGAGDNKRVMQRGFILQWIIFLPLAWVFAKVMGYGVLGLWIAESIHGIGTVVLYASMWVAGKWKTIKI